MMKVSVYGDSIAAGVGARGRQFPVLVAERLGAQLDDRTGSAKTAVESAAEAPTNANLVIVQHGTTDAMIRPSEAAVRHLPRRYRQPGWLDKRAFYSTRRWRRLVEHGESAARWRLQRLLIRSSGVSLVSLPEYLDAIRYLASQGERALVVSHTGADARFFPGSEEQLDLYWEQAVNVTPMARHVDVRTRCRRWADYLDDHFHPNALGHEAIASAILSALKEE